MDQDYSREERAAAEIERRAEHTHDHDALLVILKQHGELLKEIKEQTVKTNGRVNDHDVQIGKMNWALFIGGPAAIGGIGVALGWLIVMHLK